MSMRPDEGGAEQTQIALMWNTKELLACSEQRSRDTRFIVLCMYGMDSTSLYSVNSLSIFARC